jgi:hypothetical protein
MIYLSKIGISETNVCWDIIGEKGVKHLPGIVLTGIGQ